MPLKHEMVMMHVNSLKKPGCCCLWS